VQGGFTYQYIAFCILVYTGIKNLLKYLTP